MSRSSKIFFAIFIPAIFLWWIGLDNLQGPHEAPLGSVKTDIAVLNTALDMFQVDCNRCPTPQEGLAALVDRPAAIPATSWHGPYLDKDWLHKDIWGRPYVYKCPGEHNTNGYDVYSLGPSGKGGDDAIGNWTSPTDR